MEITNKLAYTSAVLISSQIFIVLVLTEGVFIKFVIMFIK